jgi:hypothetical protein
MNQQGQWLETSSPLNAHSDLPSSWAWPPVKHKRRAGRRTAVACCGLHWHLETQEPLQRPFVVVAPAMAPSAEFRWPYAVSTQNCSAGENVWRKVLNGIRIQRTSCCGCTVQTVLQALAPRCALCQSLEWGKLPTGRSIERRLDHKKNNKKKTETSSRVFSPRPAPVSVLVDLIHNCCQHSLGDATHRHQSPFSPFDNSSIFDLHPTKPKPAIHGQSLVTS